MAFTDIFLLAGIEIFGDFNLRWYAQSNALHYLYKGIGAYIGVVYFLIRSLRTDNVLFVNNVWDGLSSLIESVAAYYYLGDRLTSIQQYIGVVFVIIGVALMKIGR